MKGGDSRQIQAGGAVEHTEAFGCVLSVRGSQVSVGLSRQQAEDPRATVGNFMAVQCHASVLVGVVTEIGLQVNPFVRDQGFVASAQLDLMGELRANETGGTRFVRGVESYPAIGDPVALVTAEDLRTVYDIDSGNTVHVGWLNQDHTIGALVDVDDMLSKHFAVLGTTGVGKSSGVALILRETLERRPDLRMFLIDVHNEYARSFGDRAQILNPRNLKLPFWLFNFEEIIDVFFGARPGVEEEVLILSEVVPIAKVNYLQYRNGGSERTLKRIDPRSVGYTVDTPVPYRLADLLALIDERMGKLENRSSRMVYHKLIARIEAVANDPRYSFMFENANVGGDTMAEVLSMLFRLPTHGKPVSIMQIAGFPTEVVDSLVSVVCRMAFDFGLWSDGAVPLLFVCEEAHRYACADRSVGFGPTRKAISRIAKEGRKYGVFLGLVTQRPAELDPTIISQCSTLFAMRMANERDQALLRSAVSDAAANLLAFVPSLGTREVLAFGEGVALPTRMRFKELPEEHLPRSEALGAPNRVDVAQGHDLGFISCVLERWRGATLGNAHAGVTPRYDDAVVPEDALGASAHGLDPDRFKILKKPLTAGSPAPSGPVAAPRPTFGSPPARQPR